MLNLGQCSEIFMGPFLTAPVPIYHSSSPDFLLEFTSLGVLEDWKKTNELIKGKMFCFPHLEIHWNIDEVHHEQQDIPRKPST
jgi:hypothetical protein